MTAVSALRGARAIGLHRRRITVGALVLLVAALFALTLCIGTTITPPSEVLRVLTGQFVPGAGFAVGELRLPRAIDALLVGLAFGMSGTIFQTMLRNVLASPDVIGVSAGASASAVIGITVFGASGLAVSGVAVAGALLTAGAMYLLAYRGGLSGYRLVLIGIGVAALLQALVSFVLTRSSVSEAQDVLVWLTGSLNRSLWNQVPGLTVSLLVLVPAALLLSRSLGALQLGDDAAAGLGLRVERSRLALILVAVALAAVATAAAGPVAFVALLAGPIARRVTRASDAALVPSALVGAVIVLAADFAGQHLLGTRFPVGVVTGAIGAPYLLWMLALSNRKGTGA
ncbi:MAG TPA: iron chelate uptake ABC transporter family permease subunit [Lacisediminihabitans sp.]|uniref:FecCD family ABC transporter permease n=1 Tax=Lacisediminihabitans sp. TaxID=2787631 RepID=UPI002EDA9A8A